MPPGGRFFLSDLFIDFNTRPGAEMLLDTTRVYHHSEDAGSCHPKYASRMGCGLYMSKKVCVLG